MPDTDQSRRPFQLGLVLAGATSAGAYSAGVLDFLIQALEEWSHERQSDPSLPAHGVEIQVMSGASAGGMTAALAAAALNYSFPPAAGGAPGAGGSAPAGTPRNALYEAWVEGIDIVPLLATSDLARPGARVRSILDSSSLEQIAADAFRFPAGPPVERPYIAPELHLYLTVTNLRGVPYRIAFAGAGGAGHEISRHADHLHFVRSAADPGAAGARWLDPADPQHENWRALREAALASGAFPVGLAPRLLSRPAADYDALRWRIPQELTDAADPAHGCYREQPIPPAWQDGLDLGAPYRFLCLDGGLMDNEPLELARRHLARELGSNPREPEKADRAVILIDPFPAADWPGEPRVEFGLPDLVLDMFSSLKAQARFKPEELVLAQDPNVYSRFLIAPSRSQAGGLRAAHPLAAGMLGGFGGFLSRRFRHHDFQLGRRNCQRFLARHLALPLEAARRNPVFSGVGDVALQRFRFPRDGHEFFPLIPLVGSAAAEVELVPWETLALTPLEFEPIRRALRRRAYAVLQGLARREIRSPLLRLAGGLAALAAHDALARRVAERIRHDLVACDLWREPPDDGGPF